MSKTKKKLYETKTQVVGSCHEEMLGDSLGLKSLKYIHFYVYKYWKVLFNIFKQDQAMNEYFRKRF